MKKEYVTVALSDLRPYENNPRRNDQAVEAVQESIHQVGYISPIIIDENNEILAGHTRLKALKLDGGVQEVEVIRVSGLSDEQKRKYRLLDNRTSELASWDFELLEIELEDIDFQGFDFEFHTTTTWFDTRTRYDNEGIEDESDEYQDFIAKFEQARTTDDCYTPDLIYEAVVEWVEDEYGVNRSNFVRPFYPGGDYQNHKYRENDIVVDNPPFSIFSEIVTFYCEKGIRFFLFAPSLTIINSADKCTAVAVNVGVTYENGASVSTSFCTNMEDEEIIIRTAPELYKKLFETNKEVRKEITKALPKYEYPDQIVTAAMMGRWSKYGIDQQFNRKNCAIISALDSQKEAGKAIYGKGLLLSERAAAERAAAERWTLSEREWRMVKELG